MTTPYIPPLNADTNGLPDSLEGQLLLAMPGMPDERFAGAVVYMCAHSEEGAMGLMLNVPADYIDFSDLAYKLYMLDEQESSPPPLDVPEIDVLIGGPVEQQRGFVLHTPDYVAEDHTLPVDGEFCLTATLDIIHAIAAGDGPEKALLALGYAGWAPGQLENELRENGWLHCSATPELVFGLAPEARYHAALSSMGISEAHLSALGGSA